MEWIKCSERMPEKVDKYLVFVRSFVTNTEEIEFFYVVNSIEIDCYGIKHCNENENCLDSCGSYGWQNYPYIKINQLERSEVEKHVTHWMPLPECPE